MSSWERRMGDGAVQASQGDLRKAIQAYDDAVGVSADDRQRSRALAGRGAVRDRSGDAGGREDLEEALRLAETADPDELFLRRHDVGVARVLSGRAESALPLLEAAWRDAPTMAQQLPSIEVLGQAYLDVGELRQAESCFLQLLSVAQAAQRPDAAVRAHNGRGEALRRMDRRDEAKGCFQRVVEVLGPIQKPDVQQCEQAGVALHNLGVLFLEARPEAAGKMLDQAVRCFVDAFGTAVHPHVARSKAFQGKLALDQGLSKQASNLFAEALRLVDASDPIATELVPSLRGDV